MEVQENIARRGPVIWAEYEAKLDQLDILFSFVGHAFEKLSDSKRKDFLRLLKLDAESSNLERIATLRVLSEKADCVREAIDNGLIEHIQKKHQQLMKNKFRSKNPKQYAEWVADGMVSAGILFRVTILEDFLKHAHAAILKEDTKILSCVCPDRPSTNREIFSNSFEQFKERQICREVDDVDKRRIGQRIDYFTKYLRVDLGENRKELIEISNIRNNIAHQNPLAAITKDDTTLPLENIQHTVANIIRSAMHSVFTQGMAKYHSSFRLT
jgi:hypothetical protein